MTIDWSAYERTPFPGESQCAFWGMATIAAPGGKQAQRRVIDFRAAAGRENTVLDAEGLRLRASCLGGTLGVVARTGVDHAVLHVNSQELSEHYSGDENLRRDERFNLFPRLGSTGQLDTGQLIYTNRTARSSAWIGSRAQTAHMAASAIARSWARLVSLARAPADRALFARRRAGLLTLPLVAPRGVPSPEFEPFYKRPAFELRAACNRAEFYEDLLFVRAELLQPASSSPPSSQRPAPPSWGCPRSAGRGPS